MPTKLRWLTVLLPVVLTGALEVASDAYLDPVLPAPLDVLVVPALVLVFALVFARLAFRHIDALSGTLRQRNETLERRNASLQALREVGLKIAALVRLDDVLQAIVDDAAPLLGADVAFIALEDADGSYRLVATNDRSAGGPHDRGVARWSELVRPELLQVQLVAPLQRGTTTIGVLVVGARERPLFGPEEFEILSPLAAQAAVALENDRLQRELRELAIRGERERIAREMHDGLAQVLGYVNTKAQAAEELVAAGQSERARQQLGELAAAARSVYVDVREAILGLSSPIAPERGLVGALEEYAVRFSEASKLAAVVEASDDAKALRLSPEIQAQVFRIVQEALTNVRKHAAARRAQVRVSVDEGELRLAVADDGTGFDARIPATDGWPRYGLRAMRERAASIGASVSWTSDGGGTILRLALPLGTAHAV